MQLVRANGADETIDHTRGDTIELLKELYPSGVQAVVDLINQSDALIGSAGAVMDGGKLISTLAGPASSQFPRHVDVHYIQFSTTPGDLWQLVSSVTNRSLRSNGSAKFAFSEAPGAYTSLRDSHVRGKIVVEA